ncbi:hypothetical protein OAI84_00645 [bacterium]|nr:hypothetical protein [bacterium]
MNQELNISENQIVEKPPSCYSENKSGLLFLFAAVLGLLWVGLNVGGYI